MKKNIKVGFVYILTNSAMPEFVKVGYTEKEPALRARELSNTSVPLPYEIYYEELVEHPTVIEKLMHAKLSNYRVAPDREFFKVTPAHAEEVLNVILYGAGTTMSLDLVMKRVESLLTLIEKYPDGFGSTEIKPATIFRMFKTFERMSNTFRDTAIREFPEYELFMNKMEGERNQI